MIAPELLCDSPAPAAASNGRWALAVGHDCADVAALVGAQRDAELLQLDRLVDVVTLIRNGLSGVAFLVVDAGNASAEDLVAIAAAAAASPHALSLGILRGRGASQVRSAASRLAPRPSTAPSASVQRVFVAADQPLVLRGAILDDGELCTRSPEQTLAALREPSALSYFVGHANAMHLCLDGVLVCQRAVSAVTQGELSVYPCFHGEACHFGVSRGDRAFSVHDLQARRLVSLACFGASTSNVPFSAQHSVGEALLQHSAIEATLTTCRAATVTSADLALVYYLVNSGLAFGAIARRVNAFRMARGEAADLVCFGDPETHLRNTLEDVPCRRLGTQLILDPGESGGVARDLVAQLPPGMLPDEPVLLDESAGEILNAVLEPSVGALYVTISRDWRAQPVRFTVVNRSDLRDIAGSAGDLAEDMAFLDTYLPLLREVNGVSPGLQELDAAADALREQLRAWPLSELPLCQRIEERQIAALWREVRRLVRDLGTRFVAYYVQLMSLDHRTHPTPWDSRVVTAETRVGAFSCEYCGHPVDELRTRARFGAMQREWALCRTSCAYVYDGHPDLGRWIQAPRVLDAGEAHEIVIDTRNPYGLALEAHAAGVLKHFERGRCEATSIASLGLAPGATGCVRLALHVPGDFVSGTYHLSACLVLGTKVNFLRTQVAIRGRARTKAASPHDSGSRLSSASASRRDDETDGSHTPHD